MVLMKDATIPDISGVPGRPEDPERCVPRSVSVRCACVCSLCE